MRMKKKVLLFLHCFAVMFCAVFLVRIVTALIYGLADGTFLSRLFSMDFCSIVSTALV